ncbi:MAG: hypothetical protein ACYC5N_01030 [Endomicrobiales bacterium]
MNKTDLKKLAFLTVGSGEVSPSVREHILTRLSREDVKKYLFYLKAELADRQVRVTAHGAPAEPVRNAFQRLFPGRELVFATDEGLGAGFSIEHRDDIINLHLKNLIERTIDRVKENL